MAEKRQKAALPKPLWALSVVFSNKAYLRLERRRQMLIVDGQNHLWEKGTPSPPHRQGPYSAEQAIAAMDEASVDRALIHPVLWDPDSNELAIEAVRKYPNRFAIMGWFYLNDPNGRDLVAHWKD
jgi:predicted TIM-barrel fold metal-dependent hydrolase